MLADALESRDISKPNIERDYREEHINWYTFIM